MNFVKVNGKERKVFFKYNKAARTLINKKGETEHQKHPVATKCFIADASSKDNVLGTGEALCSENDQFEYSVGRKIALRRALENSGFSREERTEFWKEFLST